MKTAAISIRPAMVSEKSNLNHFLQLANTPRTRRTTQNDAKIARFRKRLFFIRTLYGKGFRPIFVLKHTNSSFGP
jgi:hypothetical protein